MAKKLTYFQFEPATYLTGSIQFCSLEAQGLYVNICCFYWQRQCELTEENLHKKFDKKELILELIKENAIKIKKGNVIIDFLISQLESITSCKLKLSESGRKGGLKSATIKSEARLKHLDKIREDKRREDYIREEATETKKDFILKNQVEVFFEDLPNSIQLENYCMINNIDKISMISRINEFKKHASSKYSDFMEFFDHFKRWVLKNPTFKSEQTTAPISFKPPKKA